MIETIKKDHLKGKTLKHFVLPVALLTLEWGLPNQGAYARDLTIDALQKLSANQNKPIVGLADLPASFANESTKNFEVACQKAKLRCIDHGDMIQIAGTNAATKPPKFLTIRKDTIKVNFDFPEPTQIEDVTRPIAIWMGMHTLIPEHLRGRVRLVGFQKTSRATAYKAFQIALDTVGYEFRDRQGYFEVVKRSAKHLPKRQILASRMGKTKRDFSANEFDFSFPEPTSLERVLKSFSERSGLEITANFWPQEPVQVFMNGKVSTQLGAYMIHDLAARHQHKLRRAGVDRFQLKSHGTPPPAALAMKARSIKTVDKPAIHVVNLSRRHVDQGLGEGFTTAVMSARIVPFMKDGQVAGFRIFGIKTDSLFAKIGFQDRDVIRQINATNLDKANLGFALFESLSEKDDLKFYLDRGEEKTEIHLKIQ